jgi:hypothetical protein
MGNGKNKVVCYIIMDGCTRIGSLACLATVEISS